MDWTTVITEILWMEEITEKELCNRLTTPVSQPAINRLKKGCTKTPKYNLGRELLQRHKKLKQQNVKYPLENESI